jgi:rod shape-determining protein MreC
MLKKKHYLALGAVVLAVLLIFSLPQRATSRLKLAIGSLFLPLFGLLNTAQRLPVDAADAVMPRRALLKENERLQRENQQLRIQMARAAAITRENDQLRALIGWQRQMPWKLRLANVVMRDPANWWRTVQIDLGKRDGIVPNMPVLTPEGLVGRVSAVGFARSQVVLVGDPDCRVSALVENATHDIGIITPSGPLDSSLVDLTYLSGNADLRPGENVVTSGEGGIFPRGIPIGQIVDSRTVEFGLYTEARVKLSANTGGLEQVWVLFPGK